KSGPHRRSPTAVPWRAAPSIIGFCRGCARSLAIHPSSSRPPTAGGRGCGVANGGGVGAGGAIRVAGVPFGSRATLASITGDPWLRFGDAYSDGLVVIEGDLVRLLETVYRSSSSGARRGSLLRRAAGALRRPHTNTLTRSRDNIH